MAEVKMEALPEIQESQKQEASLSDLKRTTKLDKEILERLPEFYKLLKRRTIVAKLPGDQVFHRTLERLDQITPHIARLHVSHNLMGQKEEAQS